MTKMYATLLFIVACNLHSVAQHSIVGLWKNLDDEDGKEKSHIRVYEEKGFLKAKVIKLLPAATLKVCTKCAGPQKDKPIEGMEIMWGLKRKNDVEYEGGKILNPKNGKIYSCKINLEKDNRLKVHGYLGFSFIGKSQYWLRVQE